MKKIRYHQGFTLVELMIAVAIVAILASIAYPYYDDAIMKSRRSDAITTLLSLQMAQEKHRANNSSYATSVGTGSGGLGWSSSTTDNGYYSIAITAGSATGFTATATAVTGKGQDKDTGCTTFTVNQNGKAGDNTACW